MVLTQVTASTSSTLVTAATHSKLTVPTLVTLSRGATRATVVIHNSRPMVVTSSKASQAILHLRLRAIPANISSLRHIRDSMVLRTLPRHLLLLPQGLCGRSCMTLKAAHIITTHRQVSASGKNLRRCNKLALPTTILLGALMSWCFCFGPGLIFFKDHADCWFLFLNGFRQLAVHEDFRVEPLPAPPPSCGMTLNFPNELMYAQDVAAVIFY